MYQKQKSFDFIFIKLLNFCITNINLKNIYSSMKLLINITFMMFTHTLISFDSNVSKI